MKKCSICKIVKDLAEFVRAEKELSGHASSCKECQKKKREDNREERLAKRKFNYQKNKAKVLATNKQWLSENDYKQNITKEAKAKNNAVYYEKNKKEIIAKAKEYNKNNKEKIAKRVKEYYKTEQGKLTAASTRQKRRSQILSVEDGTATTKSLELLKEQQEHKCYHCGDALDYNTPRAVHLDHLIPLSKGGKHTLSNVRWSCAYCNLSKGAKL